MQKFKHYIPFILSGILLIFLFSSCVATKNQKARFLAQYCTSKDSIVTVTKDSIAYRDSIIKIPTIVNTPIYLENPCKLLCDSLGQLKPIFRSQKNGGLKSMVSTIGNVLAFDCRTDSLTARIQFLERYIKTNNFVGKSKILKEECEKEHRTKFDGFTFWWFWITAGLLILIFIGKFFKNALLSYFPILKIIMK